MVPSASEGATHGGCDWAIGPLEGRDHSCQEDACKAAKTASRVHCCHYWSPGQAQTGNALNSFVCSLMAALLIAGG